MINIKRRPAPRAGERLLNEKNKLSEHIDQLRSNLERSKFEGTIIVTKNYLFREILDLDTNWYDELQKQFNSRCAYCETYVGSNGIVEHFRPVDGLKDEKFFHNQPVLYRDFYYIWLAYQWSNLVLSCPDCNYKKGNYFPVNGNRAKLFGEVRHEACLIIDPCKDNPAEHLKYNLAGYLMPKSIKGEVTIDLLDLNRLTLVSARREQIHEIEKILENTSQSDWESIVSELRDTVFLESLVRQLVAEWIASMNQHERLQISSSAHWGSFFRSMYGSFQTTKNLMDNMQPYSNTLFVGYHSEEVLNFKVNRIEYINIRNVRGITFEHFFNRHEKNESWLMFLGENGTGKTTVLKAIAMALTNSWKGLGINPSSFLTSGNNAEIIVKLESSNEPIKVQINRSDVIHLNPPPLIPIVAYGAVRLIPSRIRRSKNRSVHWHNVRNLFASSSTGYFVNHPKEWLDNEDTLLEEMAKIIINVLPFEESEQVALVIERKMAFIERNGRRIALHELSSGYQSIIALITGIAQTLHQTSGLGKFSEGLVLIDEIDAHLHPSWKLNIVEKLKAVFPRVQFIVTSHDPLCLRGTHYGEIAVMKRCGEEVTVMTNLPDQEGMRVDQILTSEFFDLNSTIDAKIDKLIAKYQRLLSQNNLNTIYSEELNSIEKELDDPTIRYLGYTNRERLMYRTIDHFIASRKKNKIAYSELDEETRLELLRILETEEDDL